MYWTWHICVPHQAIFATECRDCVLTKAILEEKEIKKLERIAAKAFRVANEKEEEERAEKEEERAEKERQEAEEAARSLISISRITEVEREFPLIVSLLRAPSKVNGRRQ